ncbi:MAG: hypothetical protein ACP5LH_02575 [Candidatus Micrarchaeia archaeon]
MKIEKNEKKEEKMEKSNDLKNERIHHEEIKNDTVHTSSNKSNKNNKDNKSFFSLIKAPLLLWLIFYIIFLIGGVLGVMQLSAMLIFGSYYTIFIPMLFGLWIGKITSKNLRKFSHAIIASFSTVIIIGLIGFAFVAFLNNYSVTFAQEVFGAPAALSLPLLLQYFSIFWIEMLFVTILAAVVGFEFSNNNNI